MTTLYELTDQYRQALAVLDDMDLDAQTVADTLEGLKGALQEKATNVAMYVRNLEATAAAIKNAEDEMARRREAVKNRAKSIRDYLLTNMQKAEITKIECPYFVISRKMNPPAVVIDDEESVPDKFYSPPPPPPPPKLDKAAIRTAIKAGETVAGARLVQGERVEIK